MTASFGSGVPRPELVPSLSFLPTSTVYSASTSCRYVATRSRPWGSPCFRPSSARSANGTHALGSSPMAPDPSEPFPRLQPYRVTAASYLLAVPPGLCSRYPRCRGHAITGSKQPTSRSCSTAESVAAPGVATTTSPDAPLGLSPFEVSVDSSARFSEEPHRRRVRPEGRSAEMWTGQVGIRGHGLVAAGRSQPCIPLPGPSRTPGGGGGAVVVRGHRDSMELVVRYRPCLDRSRKRPGLWRSRE